MPQASPTSRRFGQRLEEYRDRALEVDCPICRASRGELCTGSTAPGVPHTARELLVWAYDEAVAS